MEHSETISATSGNGPRSTLVYWKGDQFWIGKLAEFPDVVSQGETVDELVENIRDAYRMLVLEDVPEEHQTREVAL